MLLKAADLFIDNATKEKQKYFFRPNAIINRHNKF